MEIKDLRDGMKRIDVEAKVVEKGQPREVKSKFKEETYRIVDAIIADLTGSIKLTLWNEQADAVNVNDNIQIENAYVTSFKGDIQLNIGKFGKLMVVVK